MTDEKPQPLARVTQAEELDIGKPVAWMLDPEDRQKIVGVTYAFSHSGERRTVWYTANKRRAKNAIVVTELVAPERKPRE